MQLLIFYQFFSQSVIQDSDSHMLSCFVVYVTPLRMTYTSNVTKILVVDSFEF